MLLQLEVYAQKVPTPVQINHGEEYAEGCYWPYDAMGSCFCSDCKDLGH